MGGGPGDTGEELPEWAWYCARAICCNTEIMERKIDILSKLKFLNPDGTLFVQIMLFSALIAYFPPDFEQNIPPCLCRLGVAWQSSDQGRAPGHAHQPGLLLDGLELVPGLLPQQTLQQLGRGLDVCLQAACAAKLWAALLARALLIVGWVVQLLVEGGV